MEKSINNKKFNILGKVISLLLCFLFSVLFVACDVNITTDENGNIIIEDGSGDDLTWDDGVDGDGNNILTTKEKYLGVVASYDVGGEDPVFFDKWTNENKSFNNLLDRQFNALSTYLYNNLILIYGDSVPSNTIEGYASSVITYDTESVLTAGGDNLGAVIHSAIAGLTNNNITNKNNLDYKNSINGGYKLAPDGVTWEYSNDNAWKWSDSFSQENLQLALAYIYKNIQVVDNTYDEDDELCVTDNDELITYYSELDLSDVNLEVFADNNQFETIGFSREYMCNVLYFLAYAVIGENRFSETIENYNKVFSDNSINNVNSSNEGAFKLYKGYDVVLTNLVKNAFNASIVDEEIVYKDYFAKENWDSTLYPIMKRQEFVYYRNIDRVLNDEEAKRLVSLTYIPYITDDEYKDTTFTVDFIFVALNTDDEIDDFNIEIKFNGVFCDGQELKDSKIIFSDEYSSIINGNIIPSRDLNDSNLIDGYIDYLDGVEHNLSSAETLNGEIDIADMINNSFSMTNDEERNKKGILAVYNQFIYINNENNVEFNLAKNYYSFNFEYYNNANEILTSIPYTYLVSLYQI